MATPAVPPASRTTAIQSADVGVTALARALRQKREEAQALVRLVEQASASNDKGQNVDYYA
jgi:hypothetical protein